MDMLIAQDWTEFEREDDPGILWEIMFKHITAVLDCICPLTTVFVPTTKPKWITNNIIELMRDRDSFYRKAGRYGQPDDGNIAQSC